MWKIVRILQKPEQVEEIKKLLQSEGFLVDINSNNSSSFEVRVTSSEVEEVNELLCNYRCRF